MRNEGLIAPCGMNCGICMAYLRDKKKCPGCRTESTDKNKSCTNCQIKNCDKYSSGEKKFCYECDKFPCKLIEHIDKRYRTKYHMSMVDNLLFIKKNGVNTFVESQKLRWACKRCGGVICVHRAKCASCGEAAKN